MSTRGWRWSTFRLRTKGLIVVSLPIAPLALLWLLIGLAMIRDSPPSNTLTRSREIQAGLARIVAGLLDAEAAIQTRRLGGTAESSERYQAARDRLPVLLADVDRAIVDEATRALLQPLRALVDEELSVLDTLSHLAPSPPSSEATQLIARVDAITTQARATVEAIERRQQTLTVQRTGATQQRGRWIFGLFLGASVLCTVGGVVAALVLANGIRRRIGVLTEDAERLAQGGVIDRPSTGDDEIGHLGESLREAGRLLRQRDLDLRQAAHSLDSFFHLSRDLFCIAGVDGRFKRLNAAWEETLGFGTDELTSQPFIEWVHPDDRAGTEAVAAGLGRGEEAVSFENRYRCRDGSYRWLLWNARVQVGEGLIYATARDVTERREAMERLDQLNTVLREQTAQLEASNRELEAFSYSVSHDLRAPLRAIDGFTQVIEEEQADRLDAAGRDALRRVRAAATRMGTLIDELLNLARLTRLEPRYEAIDLSAMAETIVSELERNGNARQIRVTVAPNLTATGDPRMVRILLQNLLHNAWKYTGKTPEASIEVGASQNGGPPVFHVRDNGAGFDMAYAGKLFGAFQRLHADRDFEGTGIGLATVQRIVHRHGGRVWADSTVDRGATFYFTLESTRGD